MAKKYKVFVKGSVIGEVAVPMDAFTLCSGICTTKLGFSLQEMVKYTVVDDSGAMVGSGQITVKI